MQMTDAAASRNKIKVQEIEIRPLRIGDDATAFRILNEEWITTHFTLEPKDRETLNDPEGNILRKGGQVFIAYLRDEALGCVALIPMNAGQYELSKMAVTPAMRGLGIGRILIDHVIAHARLIGAKSLFLGSNTKLPAAVRLYESVGFRHVPAQHLPPMHYARADVFMEMPLHANILIRLATADDIPVIMQTIRRVVPLMRETANLQWDEHYPNPDNFTRNIDLAQLWTAEIDGHLAGFAAFTSDQEPEYADVGWDLAEPAIVVHRLAVDPGFQGKGVAIALLQHAEIVAIQRGIAQIRIDTNTHNQITQRLLPKLGYRLVGEIGLKFRPGLRFFCYDKLLPLEQ